MNVNVFFKLDCWMDCWIVHLVLERIQELRLVHQPVDCLLVLPLPLKGAEEAVPDDQGPGVVLVLHTCRMQKYLMVLVNWFWGALFPRTSDPIFHESLFFHPIPLHGYVPRPFISISFSPPEGIRSRSSQQSVFGSANATD